MHIGIADRLERCLLVPHKSAHSHAEHLAADLTQRGAGVAFATVSQVVEWELARSALLMAQPQLKKATRLLFSSSRVVSVRDTLPAPD
jgi:hypothetical protein